MGFEPLRAVHSFLDSTGAPYLPGFGRCGKAQSRPAALESTQLKNLSSRAERRGAACPEQAPSVARCASNGSLALGHGKRAKARRLVSGHEFTRAEASLKSPGFSPCGPPISGTKREGARLQSCRKRPKIEWGFSPGGTLSNGLIRASASDVRPQSARSRRTPRMHNASQRKHL